MDLSRRSRAALFVLAAAPLAIAPTPAGAAAFGPPAVISGTDDASDPQVAIAPSGRTAVMYQRYAPGKRSNTIQFRAAIGRDPEHLGRATTVQAGTQHGYTEAVGQLLAQPDGGFVACFPAHATKTGKVAGCSFASPTGTFGPLHVVQRFTDGRTGGFTAAVRPDGSLLLMIVDYRRSSSEGKTSWAVMSRAGVLGPVHPLVRPAAERSYGSSGSSELVVAADGTAAIPATVPVAGDKNARYPAISLMPPGASAFGPPIQVSTERLGDAIQVTTDPAAGAGRFVVQFDARVSPDFDVAFEQRIVREQPDGSFAAALALPGPQSKGLYGAPLILPAGEPLGVTEESSTDPDDSDCYNQLSGTVSAGPLGAVGQPAALTPLSDPHQIALYPQHAVLADGTAIVSWENAASFNGDSRLQVAIRPPGATAFARPRALPKLGWLGRSVLASGGGTAALAWTTNGVGQKDKLVVSALRTAAPYAKFVALPKHPEAPCDE
jgi:hypothetical protein